MSYLNTRIGRSFTKLKKSVNRDGFVLRVNRLKAVTTAEMTSWSEVNPKQDIVKSNSSVVELDNEVKRIMWRRYLDDGGRLNYFYRKRHDLKLDWSSVTFLSDKPEYKKRDEIEFPFQNLHSEVINNVENMANDNTGHKVMYTNNSSIEQTQRIETVLQQSLSQQNILNHEIGLALSMKSGISFADPQAIAKASASSKILQGMTSKIHGETGISKKKTLFREDTIKIPSRSSITVTTHNKHNRELYDFTTWVTVRGEVKGMFFNFMKREVNTVNIPMDKILSEVFTADMLDGEHGSLKVKYEGRCEIYYETEQTKLFEENKQEN